MGRQLSWEQNIFEYDNVKKKKKNGDDEGGGTVHWPTEIEHFLDRILHQPLRSQEGVRINVHPSKKLCSAF